MHDTGIGIREERCHTSSSGSTAPTTRATASRAAPASASAIARELVSQHGGKINVDERQGRRHHVHRAAAARQGCSRPRRALAFGRGCRGSSRTSTPVPMPTSDNAAHNGRARRRAARAAGPRPGGRRPRSVERHRARGKLLARERIDRLLDPGAPFLELARARRLRACTTATRRRRASSPASARCAGATCMIVANDATVKGGTYYPLTVKKHLRAQEIAAAEPPALHLPGRLRRRLPAAAGRGLPRPRPLRAHLLQPGADVGAGHPADRRGDGLVHGRRRLRAGDERRDGDRARHRHDLPGRPAAGEGGDRRGGDAPRSWAAPTCTRASPASPTTSRVDDEHALAIAARSSPTCTAPSEPPWDVCRPGRPLLRSGRAVRHRARATRATATTCAR